MKTHFVPALPRPSWTLTAMGLLAAASLTACHPEKKDESAAAEPEAVHRKGENELAFPNNSAQLGAIKTVEASEANEMLTHLTGRLAWDEDHTIRIFTPVSGRVEKIKAEIGQRVSKDDELAVLRSPDFGQAQADYRKAEADLALTDKTLSRQSQLLEKGAAALKDVESAQADYNRALAEKQRAELRLQMLGTIGKTFEDTYRVVAPLGGVVVDRKLTVGQEIRSDIQLGGMPELVSPIFTITNPERLWLILDVPEALLPRIRVGQQVQMKAAAYPDQSFTGVIELVGASLDPVTRVAHARAVVNNKEGLLRAEMYVGATISLPATQLTKGSPVQLPTSAVFFLDGKYFLFVETNKGVFERREVKPERETAEIVVLSGVAVRRGEHVVSEGGLFLNEILGQLSDDGKPSAS